MSEETANTRKIAAVKDNVVIEIMHTDDATAEMFLSGPIFVDATAPRNMCKTYKGDTYDPNSGKFDQESKLDYDSPYIEE
jgi:hypothetical protein